MPKLPHTLSFLALISTGVLSFFVWQSHAQNSFLTNKLKLVSTQIDQINMRLDDINLNSQTPTYDLNLTPTTPYPSAPPTTLLDKTNTITATQSSAQTAALQSEVSSLKNQLTSLEKKVDALPRTQTKVVTSASATREYLIFLGSGSTLNRDWTVIPGAGVTLDLSSYKNIKSINFEAGLSIVSGESYARLYDQTTRTPYAISEVMNNTSGGTWITSPSFALPSGSHYYTVQLKSSNGEPAQLIGARLKIRAD